MLPFSRSHLERFQSAGNDLFKRMKFAMRYASGKSFRKNDFSTNLLPLRKIFLPISTTFQTKTPFRVHFKHDYSIRIYGERRREIRPRKISLRVRNKIFLLSVNPKEVYFSSSFFSSYLFPSPISSLPLENVYFCRNFDVSEFSKTPENSETISTENIHLRIPTAFLPKSDLPFPLIFFTNKQSALMKLSKFLLRISTHPFDLVSRLDVITKSVHLINFFFFFPP